MVKVTYDISLDLWVKGIEIEGKTEEECKQRLLDMNLDELLDTGYTNDFEVKNISGDVEEEEEEDW